MGTIAGLLFVLVGASLLFVLVGACGKGGSSLEAPPKSELPNINLLPNAGAGAGSPVVFSLVRGEPVFPKSSPVGGRSVLAVDGACCGGVGEGGTTSAIVGVDGGGNMSVNEGSVILVFATISALSGLSTLAWLVC